MSAHEPLVAHTAEALKSLGWVVRFPWQFAGTHLYSSVERGTVRVKCLAKEHNTMTWPGLEPRPLDPESSTPTTRPPRLPGRVSHKVASKVR